MNREFSKEKERVENRTAFLAERAAELAAEREAENRQDWLDKGEQLAMKEAEEKCKFERCYKYENILPLMTLD